MRNGPVGMRVRRNMIECKIEVDDGMKRLVEHSACQTAGRRIDTPNGTISRVLPLSLAGSTGGAFHFYLKWKGCGFESRVGLSFC